MNTATQTMAAGDETVCEIPIQLRMHALPASVIFSFVLMGLCVVLGGSLLV